MSEGPKLTKAELSRRVRDVLAEQLRVAPELVTEAADLRFDLHADSLDEVELVMALEEEFETEFEDAEVEEAKIETVGDLETKLAEKLEVRE